MPAVAVIRKWRALSGFIGRIVCVDGFTSQRLKSEAQPHYAFDTV